MTRLSRIHGCTLAFTRRVRRSTGVTDGVRSTLGRHYDGDLRAESGHGRTRYTSERATCLRASVARACACVARVNPYRPLAPSPAPLCGCMKGERMLACRRVWHEVRPLQ